MIDAVLPDVFFSETAARLARLPFELDADSDITSVHQGSAYRIALLVPLCGSAGLWSPSCVASAQVAVEELNQLQGIDGRRVQLIMIDAALEAQTPVEEIINELIDADAIDAIVGMHISAVRQRLAKVVAQRIPYIYTPLYEGGEATPGVFAIGETPSVQLGPALDHMHQTHHIKRWALIGNDYVWPRASHSFAKQKIKSLGAQLVHERYLPFGLSDFRAVLEALEQSKADGLLMSLVGQDAVAFNRAFGKRGLDTDIVRLSCAMEENGLLASGAKGLKRLYSASSYFAALSSEPNAAFREKYYALHGEHAPLLNTLGQSIYEGVHFLSSLLITHNEDWHTLHVGNLKRFDYRSARWLKSEKTGNHSLPMYLARADGVQFEIIKSL